MKINIALEEAQELLLNLAEVAGEYQVPLAEAWGKVLSRDITAPHNIPPFPKSALDGYTFRAADTEAAQSSNPVRLEIIDKVRAGYHARHAVSSGTAIKIMTGAPIPDGADAVLKWEDVQVSGNYVYIAQPYKSGDNIIPVGQDVVRGELAAPKGALITPPLVGLFANLGLKSIPVYLPVKAAILSIGDELADLSQELSPGKIYSGNSWTVAARCHELGALPIELGIAIDDIKDIADHVNRGLAEADIVITSGGASVGDYDLIKDTLVQSGAKVLFWKLAMKPGAPVVAAVKDKKLIIGLSGNPAAAMTTFDLLVIPIIKKMLGLSKQLPARIEAVMLDSFKLHNEERRLLRARLITKDTANYVKLTAGNGGGTIKSMVDANVLVDIPAGSGPVFSGQKVACFLLDHTYSMKK
jgi:molybdenum cofactor synthesis domain